MNINTLLLAMAYGLSVYEPRRRSAAPRTPQQLEELKDRRQQRRLQRQARKRSQ